MSERKTKKEHPMYTIHERQEFVKELQNMKKLEAEARSKGLMMPSKQSVKH